MKKQQVIENGNNKILNIMSSIIMLLAMFILIFNKGGYYIDGNTYSNFCIFAFALVELIYLIFKSRNDKKCLKLNVLDILILVFSSLSILNLIFNSYSNLGDTIFGLSKYICFACSYFISKDIFRYKSSLDIFLNIFLVSTLFIGILGIDQLTIKSIGKIFGIEYTTELPTRLSSVFQYANVAAVYMSIGIFISKYLENTCKNSKLKIIYSIATYILFSCVLMTQSRTCIAIDIILLFVYAIMIKNKGYRNIKIISTILTIIYSCIFYFVIYKFILISAVYDVIIYFALSIIPMIVFTISLNKITPYFLQEVTSNKFLIYCILGILALVMITGIVIWNINVPLEIKSDYSYTTNINSTSLVEIDINNKYISKYNIKYELLDINNNVIFSGDLKENINKIQINNKDAKKIKINIYDVKENIIINSLKVDGKACKLKYIILSDDLVKRFKEIFGNSESLNLRKCYFIDSIEIWKQSPIIGLGNKAYYNMYQVNQVNQYISSESHSYPMDILVNFGLIGLLLYVAILAVYMKGIYLEYKNANKVESYKYIMIMCIFLVLILHSILDLDFSYSIILYSFAIILSAIKFREYNIKVEYKHALILITLPVFIQLISTTAYIIASNIDKNSETEYKYFSKSKNDIIRYEDTVYLVNHSYDFRIKLAEKYNQYTQVLSETLQNGTPTERVESKKELKRVMPLIRENLIKIVEQNNYNKYALQKVSAMYFRNFINFSRLLGEDYLSELNYAIYLAVRIIDIGKINDNNYSFAYQTLDQMYDGLNEIQVEELTEVSNKGKEIVKKEILLIPDKINKNYSYRNAIISEQTKNLINLIENKYI